MSRGIVMERNLRALELTKQRKSGTRRKMWVFCDTETQLTSGDYTETIGLMRQLEFRSAQVYSGGHSDDIDYISWNPTHPELFCTSSQKDRRIVFWDARREFIYRSPYTLFTQSILISIESRFIQQCSLKVTPTYTQYAPDGRSLLFVTAAHQLMFMSYAKESEEAKEQWQTKVLPNQKDSVRQVFITTERSRLMTSSGWL